MASVETLPDLPMGGQLGRTLRQLSAAHMSFVEASYSPALRLPQHRHADAHFCFVLAGSVLEETAGTSYAYGRNALLFRRAGEVHAQRYGDAGARCFSFFLSASWHDRHEILPSRSECLTGPAHSHANNLVRRMYEEFRSPDRYSELAMEGLALEIIVETSRTDTRTGPGWLSDARARLEHADATGQSVRIAHLASDLGVDASQLVRSFRLSYGVSPAAFLRRRRLDRAYQLVVGSDLQIADIAARTGFCDQSHFSRAFLAVYGMAPGACRKRGCT